MALSVTEIQREVTLLSVEERARLIALLIESLEAADEGNVDAAWEQELLRRSKEIEEGKVIPVPAEEALERVRRTLR
ncbi:MAG: addiction module protein [Burkholderiales bacterium]